MKIQALLSITAICFFIVGILDFKKRIIQASTALLYGAVFLSVQFAIWRVDLVDTVIKRLGFQQTSNAFFYFIIIFVLVSIYMQNRQIKAMQSRINAVMRQCAISSRQDGHE